MDKVRFALRTLSRAPGFTVAAVLALALGVGGSTAMFSVLRGVVLKPLAPPHPEELVRLYQRLAGSEARYPFSAPDYIDLAKGNGAFQSIAGIRAERQTLTGRRSPIQIRVARVTGSFFSILRQWPSIGRAPGAEEDVAGGSRTETPPRSRPSKRLPGRASPRRSRRRRSRFPSLAALYSA